MPPAALTHPYVSYSPPHAYSIITSALAPLWEAYLTPNPFRSSPKHGLFQRERAKSCLSAANQSLHHVLNKGEHPELRRAADPGPAPANPGVRRAAGQRQPSCDTAAERSCAASQPRSDPRASGCGRRAPLSSPCVRGLNGLSCQNQIDTFRSENFTARPVQCVIVCSVTACDALTGQISISLCCSPAENGCFLLFPLKFMYVSNGISANKRLLFAI